MSTEPADLDTTLIKNWRSIVTLVVFVYVSKFYQYPGRPQSFRLNLYLSGVTILFPFHMPVFIPRPLYNAILDSLHGLRIIPHSSRQRSRCYCTDPGHIHAFVKYKFPMNFITAPLIAVLFLLAISAIGRKEVHDGTTGLGADTFSPIDIVSVFITLGYITTSIEASGLIRCLLVKALQRGGGVGGLTYFYLYAIFFGLGSLLGDDLAVLSGPAFLAYMTRGSANIINPRAWIHSQFAITKIASAILVFSNPINLILASACSIKFIYYTANIIVPVVVTAIALFPLLTDFVFGDESLIPLKIEMHQLPPEEMAKKPVNPNIPDARVYVEEGEEGNNNYRQRIPAERELILSLAEIVNPFLDRKGAAFGAIIISTSLVTLLALNAADHNANQHSLYWVTLPAAFTMFFWDIASGWCGRNETREIARKGRHEKELARAEQILRGEREAQLERQTIPEEEGRDGVAFAAGDDDDLVISSNPPINEIEEMDKMPGGERENEELPEDYLMGRWENEEMARREQLSREVALQVGWSRKRGQKKTLVQVITELYDDLLRWSQETLPTATAVITHLPFALVPFILSMFILVQGLVARRWVLVFAYGWDHWVNKTGTIGAIGGMGFLSIILCNVSFHLTDHPTS
jgi:Na+/H+ antiporter NhaD/arsenite permease-like protein